MLDERTEMMLKVASALTAEDLDTLRSFEPATDSSVVAEVPEVQESEEPPPADEPSASENTEPFDGSTAVMPAGLRSRQPRNQGSTSTLPRGEYERQRTRESKVSTSCVGHEREKHDWWPIGTQLEGRIGSEMFTALVVENAQVKSGRSMLITSGAASGKVCLTPTRAAMEATESYRQTHNMGRGGGVTNGWEFWRQKA
jgi:hypothetical protein